MTRADMFGEAAFEASVGMNYAGPGPPVPSFYGEQTVPKESYPCL